MNSPENPACETLNSFVDGELDSAEAARFQRHLPGCTGCARNLAEVLVLDDLVTAHAERTRNRRWRLSTVVAATTMLAMAAGLLIFWRREATPAPGVLVAQLAALRPRTSQARLAYLPADAHRQFAPMRGGEASQPAIPLQLVATIEAGGDRRGTAAAYFLLGMPAQVETLLVSLPESADVLCERAAALLELARAEEAMALLDRALRLQPGHQQARWNRALALQALGRRAEASQIFSTLAATDAPGWAAEARTRAQDLLP